MKRKLDQTEDLLDYRDPSDPLALHKAALVLSGLHEHTDRGLRLSTEIAIPKGSGLGTAPHYGRGRIGCAEPPDGKWPGV